MKAQGMRCHLFLPTIPWKKMYTKLLEVHCPCNHLQQGLWLKTFQMYTKPSWKSILRTVRVPSSCVGPTMWIFAGDRGVGFIQQRRLDLHLARSVAVHFQFYAIILCLFCIFYGLLLLLLLLLLFFSPLLVFILFLFLVIPFSTTCNGNRSVELLLSFMKKELGDALR